VLFRSEKRARLGVAATGRREEEKGEPAVAEGRGGGEGEAAKEAEKKKV
jgi:hypothetical protein